MSCTGYNRTTCKFPNCLQFLRRALVANLRSVLMKWWAQYVESTNNMELALKYYQMADDYLSIVRILCFLDNVEQAAEIADTSQHPAACHHLARHYENMGHTENAVKFYVKSKVYGNAIRICKVRSTMRTIALHSD